MGPPTSSKPTDSRNLIFAKGTEIDLMLMNLIECASDKNEETRQTMQQSIYSIGLKEPKLVLSSILAFFNKPDKGKKASTNHRVLLLECIEKIIREKDNYLIGEDNFVQDLIAQAVEEMTSSKEVIPEWQKAASDVLVALSTRFCDRVVEDVLKHLPTNSLPHFFVMQTLGSIAQTNPCGLANHLNSILTPCLTYLPLAKLDNMRWVIAFSLAKFCEAVQESLIRTYRIRTYSGSNSALPSTPIVRSRQNDNEEGEGNNDEEERDENNTDGHNTSPMASTDRRHLQQQLSNNPYAVNIMFAFEVIFQHWLNTKEQKLRVAVLDAIGSMVYVIESKSFEGYLKRILDGVISQYKKSNDPSAVSRCLANVLNAAVSLCELSSPGSARAAIISSPTDDASTTASSTSSPTTTSNAPPIPSAVTTLLAELESVMVTLFNQLQAKESSTNPQELLQLQKNQNEIKRCFASLCHGFADRVLTFLLHRLDQNAEKSKITALHIIRHIVISCNDTLESRKNLIIHGLRTQLNVHSSAGMSNRCKMQLAHTIISMGGHEYLQLEGGHALLEFILRQCALLPEPDADKKKSNESLENVNNVQLRHTCENILRLSTTTVPGMREVLWPRLLEFLVPIEYTEAVGAICENLVQLLTTKERNAASNADDEENGDNNDEAFIVDYDEHVNIPRPQYLVARLIVLAGYPLHGNNRGLHILRAMQLLAGNFHENLCGIWNLVIPKLISYYKASQEPDLSSEDDGPDFDQVQWEDLLLKMVAKSIEQVSDEDWTIELGEAFGQQIVLYDKMPEEKSFLFKCMGTVLANASKRDFIERQLDLVYHTTKHSNATEREGCALCYGLTSARHLDMVLGKLDAHLNNTAVNKAAAGDGVTLTGTGNPTGTSMSSSAQAAEAMVATNTSNSSGKRFFGMFRKSVSTNASASGNSSSGGESSSRIVSILSTNSTEREAVKCTQLLCFGYSLLHGPTEFVTSRLEAQVVKSVNQLSAKANKETNLRHSVIRCIELIGRSVSHEKVGKVYHFLARSDFLTMLWNYVKAEPLTEIHDDTRALCFQAAQYLVRLDPPFTDAEIRDFVTSATDAVFVLPNDGIPIKKPKDFNQEICEKIMQKTLLQVNAFFKEMFLKVPTEVSFSSMINLLLPRTLSTTDHIRLRALQAIQNLLDIYLNHSDRIICTNRRINCFGILLGHLVPRTADPLVEIRQLTVDCVQLLLELQLKVEGDPHDEQADKMMKALPLLRDRLRRIDSNIMFNTVSDLGKLLVRRIPRGPQLLEGFLPTLFQGLRDNLSNGPAASCVLINSTFKSRAQELTQEINQLMGLLHDELSIMMEMNTTRTGTLRAVRTLACQHLVSFLNMVMSQSLPLDSVWCEMLSIVFTADTTVHQQCINHIADILVRVMPYEDREDPREKHKRFHMMTQAWLSAVNCLQVVCRSPPLDANSAADIENVRTLLKKNYSRLLSLWIICLSSSFEGHVMLGKSFEQKNGAEALLAAGVKPVSISIDGLKYFLEVTESHDIMEEMNTSNSWDKFTNNYKDDFLDALNVLTRAICESQGTHLSAIVNHLVPNLTAIYEPQRITVTAIYGSILLHRSTEVDSLVDTILQHLQSKLGDSSGEVRRLSIVGLGHAGLCGDHVVHRHCTALLTSLACGMDDRQDPEDRITHASMEALTQVLNKLTEPYVRQVLGSLVLKLLPCYEKERASVRAAAFRLFGALTRFGVGASRKSFVSQADTLLIALLVHLNDDDDQVKKACKFTLKEVIPLMIYGHYGPPHVVDKEGPGPSETILHYLQQSDSDAARLLEKSKLNELIQTNLKDEDGYLLYGEFVYLVSKLLVTEFGDFVNDFVNKCLTYFKAESSQIQCNAAILTGCLLQNFTPEQRLNVQKEHVCLELINLLRAPDAKVRAKAAEAIGLLYMY